MKDLPSDFADALIELADHGADFVVVGGYAVAYHGYVRATKDLDILVRATAENARKVYRALAAFGAPLATLGATEDDFATYDGVLQIGVPPLRIDIITRIDGITFAQASADCATVDIEGRTIAVIGRDALIANKRASDRPQDRADVAALLSAND